jgi:thiamine-phosphate pyrophosphorylase
MTGSRTAEGCVHGLYVITAPESSRTAREMLQDVASAIRGGASLVQYRRKEGTAEARRREASQLAALCRSHGVPFVVNDDVVLALDVGASGVHLGKNDAPVQAAREALGAEALIGVSCYDSLERALAAETSGADYVAFGSFFPSPTKSTAVRASLELLRQARARLRVPIVAIGGITPENAPTLIETGAGAIAVISGVFGRPDVEAAARRYAGLFP